MFFNQHFFYLQTTGIYGYHIPRPPANANGPARPPDPPPNPPPPRMTYKEARRLAIQEAKRSISLADYLRDSGITLDSKLRGVCPACGDPSRSKPKKEFKVLEDKFGCFGSNCPLEWGQKLEGGRDQIGWLVYSKGLPAKDAISQFLSDAGVPEPQREDYRNPKAKEVEGPAADPDPPSEAAPGEYPPEVDVWGGEGDADAPPPSAMAAAAAYPPPASTLRRTLWVPPRDGRPRNPYEQFHAALTLIPSHREELRNKRGFSDETIDASGIRSSIAENRAPLQAIIDAQPAAALAKFGLLDKKGRGPSGKLCGFIRQGTDEESGDPIYGAGDNIIIPYLGFNGEITALRPHKDELATDDDDFRDPFDTSQRVYAALDGCGDEHPGFCVITEGECKALALWQTRIPAIGLPGIAFVKSFANGDNSTLDRLVKVLDHYKVREVVIAFDNESKEHKPDPWKRFDADIWAVVTARRLEWKGIDCKIARIPDEWREGQPPKADWDGALARFVREAGGDVAAGTSRARREFLSIIASADMPKAFMRGEDSDPPERKKIIAQRVNDLSHKPQIPSGGDREVALGRWIRRHIPRGDEYFHKLEIDTLTAALIASEGCYYHWAGSRKDKNLECILNAIQAANSELASPNLDPAEKAYWRAIKRAAGLQSQGYLKILSNFTMAAKYKVVSAASPKHHGRIMQLRNNLGQKIIPERPAASALSEPSRFRAWLKEAGTYAWLGGATEFNLMVLEADLSAAHRTVREVSVAGLDEASGIFFAQDRAFAPDGSLLVPDKKDGMIWFDNEGYLPPTENPEVFPNALPILARTPEEKKQPNGYRISDEELAAAAGTYDRACEAFEAAVGGYEGILALGMALSWYAHDEILKIYPFAPGLWVVGRRESGKSTIMKWLMMLFGLPYKAEPVSMGDGTTPVALDRNLSAVAGFPVFCDEFRNGEVTKQKITSIRNACDRFAKRKGIADNSFRTIANPPRTTPMISGESPTDDAATAGRFAHITLSQTMRRGDADTQAARYLSIQRELAPDLYRLSRAVLFKRADFCREFMAAHDQFKTDRRGAAIRSDRSLIAHGAAFAALAAFESLTCATSYSRSGFENWLYAHAAETQRGVEEMNFVEKFFKELMVVVNRKKIEDADKVLRVRMCSVDDAGNVQILEGLSADAPYYAIIESGAAHSAVSESWRRRNGEAFPLEEGALRAELRRDPYWVAAPRRGNRSHRLGRNRAPCWVLRVDLMPENLMNDFMGYAEQSHQLDQSDEPL